MGIMVEGAADAARCAWRRAGARWGGSEYQCLMQPGEGCRRIGAEARMNAGALQDRAAGGR